MLQRALIYKPSSNAWLLQWYFRYLAPQWWTMWLASPHRSLLAKIPALVSLQLYLGPSLKSGLPSRLPNVSKWGREGNKTKLWLRRYTWFLDIMIFLSSSCIPFCVKLHTSKYPDVKLQYMKFNNNSHIIIWNILVIGLEFRCIEITCLFCFVSYCVRLDFMVK